MWYIIVWRFFMNNIRKRNGKLTATYKGNDYTFSSITELIIAIRQIELIGE